MALTAEQLDRIGLHTTINLGQDSRQLKDLLLPIDHCDRRLVIKKPASSEFSADRWYSPDKSLLKTKASEWACKPY